MKIPTLRNSPNADWRSDPACWAQGALNREMDAVGDKVSDPTRWFSSTSWQPSKPSPVSGQD